MSTKKLNIVWFHDESKYQIAEVIKSSIGKVLRSCSIQIYTDQTALCSAIENMKNIVLFMSGPAARQVLSLIIKNISIQYIFLMEYEAEFKQELSEDEQIKRFHLPSNDFQNQICFPLLATRSRDYYHIIIITWIRNNSILNQFHDLTIRILIGSFLLIDDELLACLQWYVKLASSVQAMHNNSLVQSIRQPIFEYYFDQFNFILSRHSNEWLVIRQGYRILSQFYLLRQEDLFLFKAYSSLVNGYLKANNIHDLYYLANLACKFSERSKSIFQSLALHLYNETLQEIKLAESLGRKIDYRKTGRIYGSMFIIYDDREQYGMAMHYLNQLIDQYVKNNCRAPVDAYLCRIITKMKLSTKTKLDTYLHESLNYLKELEQCFDKDSLNNDCLLTMAITYTNLKRYTFALDCLDRILLKNDNNPNELSNVYRARGSNFIYLNQLDLALENYSKALDFCNPENKSQLVTANISVGITYEMMKDWDNALKYLTQALSIIEANFNEPSSSLEIIRRHLSFIHETTCLSNVDTKIDPMDVFGRFPINYRLNEVFIVQNFTIPYELLLE